MIEGYYACLIRWCAHAHSLWHARRLHAHLLRRGHLQKRVFLANLLVQTYGKCGCVEEARVVFDGVPDIARDVFTWNLMIAACTGGGGRDGDREALLLFRRMRLAPDKCTLISVLSASARLAVPAERAAALACGHLRDTAVANALLRMYGKCGSLHHAQSVFDSTPNRNIISWTSMIAAFSENGRPKHALRLFWTMIVRGITLNPITFLAALDASIHLSSLAEGKVIHSLILATTTETNFLSSPEEVPLWNALINMYGKCGSLENARSIFNRTLHRNVVSWTSMITVYAHNGHSEEAVKIFSEMDEKGVIPNKVTFLSILDAISSLGFLDTGRAIHNRILSHGLERDIVVTTALINMYSKCGSLIEAWGVFDDTHQPNNTISWTAMIASYAENGCSSKAVELFAQMESQGLKANDITFVNVLNACSLAGLLEEGWQCFDSMWRDYCIVPSLEHFVCMVDLLGRFGYLNEAEDFIRNMPAQPDIVTWTSLLVACRKYGDIERGARAAEHICELDPRTVELQGKALGSY